MPRIESWYQRHFITLFFVFAAIALVYIIIALNDTAHAYDVLRVDWLYFASVATALIAVRLGVQIPNRVMWTVSRLVDQGTLQGSPEQVEALRRRLDGRGARWALVGAIAGTIITLIATPAIYSGSLNLVSWLTDVHIYFSGLGSGFRDLSGSLALEYKLRFFVEFIPFSPILLLIGGLIGYYVPYAVSNGRLGHLVRKQQIAVQMQPTYPDGAAGLGSVGTLFLFQAQLLAIPALFFGVWSLLFVVGQNLVRSYFNGVDAFYHGVAASLPPRPSQFVEYLPLVSSWLTPYIVLFCIMVGAEILAFLVPMRSFHAIMAEEKRALIREADAIGQRIVATQKAIIDAKTPEEVTGLSEQLAVMKTYYEAVQRMPTWPLNPNTAWRFIIATSGLFVPLLAQLLVQKLVL
jgi:hypothetical protein